MERPSANVRSTGRSACCGAHRLEKEFKCCKIISSQETLKDWIHSIYLISSPTFDLIGNCVPTCEYLLVREDDHSIGVFPQPILQLLGSLYPLRLGRGADQCPAPSDVTANNGSEIKSSSKIELIQN